MKLIRVLKTAGGKIELTFAQGAAIKQFTFDTVVLALPFSTLREVELDASLALPGWKVNAIQSLGYGTNAKMMLGFNGRPWLSLGGSGESYSDLPNHQLTWETNPSKTGANRGVLTDYASGLRGANLNPNDPQGEASKFFGDLDQVFPGSLAAARRDVVNVSLCPYLRGNGGKPDRAFGTCVRVFAGDAVDDDIESLVRAGDSPDGDVMSA